VAIRNISLACQIRVEPTRRAYREEEKQRLVELFGEPHQWSQSLRSFVFAHASVAVPAFDDETAVRLPVACTRDLAVASAKYFHGLEDGVAPLSFLFSGSVFYRQDDGALQIAQIPWSKEAAYSMPVAAWERLMKIHYPDGDWIRLGSATLERLYRYKRSKGVLAFEDAVAALLDEATTEAEP
jgi:hypothetical protein